jgi:ribosomal protein L11 methylase PrmA
MRAMRWTEIRFRIPAAAVAAVETALAVAGFSAYALATRTDDDQDLLLYGQDGAVDQRALAVLRSAGLEPESATDWDEADLYALGTPEAPVRIVEPAAERPGVWIVPRASESNPVEGIAVVIPPGPAFGDGRHPTTRLCAGFLLGLDLAGARCLDVGCGSGALGILAGLRGAAAVDATDIDPDSVRLTRDAARATGDVLRGVWQGDLLAPVPAGRLYDLVIANIYADLVVDLLADPRLRDLLPRGHLICSGISHHKRHLVDAAIAAGGWTLRGDQREAWWDGLLLERR